MSSNPYQPPSSPASSRRLLPRDLGPITLAVGIVFSLKAWVILSLSLSEYFVGRRTGGSPPSAEQGFTATDMLWGLSSLALLLLWVPGIVLFLVWIRRANINADALVSGRTEFSPGWSIGWFFVPFANLVKPYQITAEIYRASDPEADEDYWNLRDVPPYLMAWWLTYLGFNFVGSRNSPLLHWSEPIRIGGWLSILQGILGATAAVLVVFLTRSVNRLQKEKARRAAAVEPAAS